jgi:hypothetical protein
MTTKSRAIQRRTNILDTVLDRMYGKVKHNFSALSKLNELEIRVISAKLNQIILACNTVIKLLIGCAKVFGLPIIWVLTTVQH